MSMMHRHLLSDAWLHCEASREQQEAAVAWNMAAHVADQRSCELAWSGGGSISNVFCAAPAAAAF